MSTTIGTVRLGQVAAIAAGQPAPQSPEDFGAEGLPLIRAGSLAALIAGADESTLEKVTDEAAARNGLRRIEPGAVLFAKSGMSAKIGLVHTLRRSAYVVSHLAVVAPGPDLDSRYLLRWLEANPPSRLIPNESYPSIRLEEIERLQVPLPSLAEQRRIAAILDKADAIRRKQQDAIRLDDELLRSAFLEMFGDPVANPRGWRKRRLQDLAPGASGIVDGPFGSSLKPESYVEAGVRVIRNFNIGDDRFDDSEFKYVTPAKFASIKRSEVRPGDVLISTKGTVGNVCLMPALPGLSVLSASGTVRIRLSGSADLPNDFLVSQMISASFKRYIKSRQAGTNQKYLNLSAIRSLEVIVPPLDQQNRFSSVRAKVLRSLVSFGQAVQKSESLTRTLQSAAFMSTKSDSR